MGFITFEELMCKIAKVQKEMEKEKAEKNAMQNGKNEKSGDNSYIETEEDKGVVIGVDNLRKRKILIKNNTLCFEPIQDTEQNNDSASKHSNSNAQKVKNVQSSGNVKECESVQGCGNVQGNGSVKSGGSVQECGNVQGNGSVQGCGNVQSNGSVQGCGSVQGGTNQKENGKTKKGDDLAAALKRFDEFWETYPKKYNVDQAKREFLNLNPDDALHKRILSAINVAKKTFSWRNQDGRFIPFPAKWLRNRCWEEARYDFYGL